MTTPGETTPETDTPRGRRRIPGGPLAAIIVGAVLATAMVFGGGVALGLALPVGHGGIHQPAFDRDGGGPMRPPGRGDGTGTHPDAPAAPNTDDTETQDESEQG
jgi:hypothetical protein